MNNVYDKRQMKKKNESERERERERVGGEKKSICVQKVDDDRDTSIGSKFESVRKASEGKEKKKKERKGMEWF